MTNGYPPPPERARVTARDRLLQTIAVLGLIAILLLGAWGIIQLAFNLPGVFSNVGGSLSGLFSSTATSTLSSKETVSVIAPESITSGAPFTLSWNHTGGSGQYGYTISYACANGVSMKAPLPNGTYQTVSCNTPFNYTNAANRTTLTPEITAASPTKVTFTVSAVRLSDNRVVVSGSASTTAQKTPAAQKTAGASTAKSNSTYYRAPSRSTLYGLPDLAVRISATPQATYGRSAIVFTVENVGTNAVLAGWTFDTNLPAGRQASLMPGEYVFRSQPQQPLYPGDKMVYTLTFDRPYGYGHNPYDYYDQGQISGGYFTDYYNRPSYGSTATVVVDPQNAVREINESNNAVSVGI